MERRASGSAHQMIGNGAAFLIGPTNSYYFYVYVENHGFDIKIRTTEQNIINSKYPCLKAKCSLLHICMLSGEAAELES